MLVFPFQDEMIFLPASGYTKTIGNFYLHAWTDMTEYFMNNNSKGECHSCSNGKAKPNKRMLALRK